MTRKKKEDTRYKVIQQYNQLQLRPVGKSADSKPSRVITLSVHFAGWL
jgi:hypothetical protein